MFFKRRYSSFAPLQSATPINREHAPNGRVGKYALLFAACLLFHLAGSWSLPLIDRDEPRFAEAAREMRARHDYIVPFFNGHYRFDKPPLTYWAQVESYRVFGENDFAARFPSAIAAALVALILLNWGTRLRDERAGWWAAIVFTLCLQVFIHGKASVADMWLVLFVTVANWAGYELLVAGGQQANIEHRRRCWWWLFYVSLALAFLAKGPIAWTPLLAIPLAKRFFPDTKLNQRFHFLPGILVMLAIVCAWGIPALLQTNGEFFWVGIGHHVIGRSFNTLEGHGPASLWMYLALLPFYFVTYFFSFFPWSLKTRAIWKSLASGRDATDNFLLLGALIIFIIFTFVRTKLPHYTLPAFPLLALLVARRYDTLRLSKTWAVGTTIIYLLVALIVPPLVAPRFASYALARDAAPALRPETEFAATDYYEPSLVWYFRKYIRGFMTTLKARDAAAYMQKPGPRFLVCSEKTRAKIFPQPDPRWKIFRTSGINIARSERLDLVLLLKPQ